MRSRPRITLALAVLGAATLLAGTSASASTPSAFSDTFYTPSGHVTGSHRAGGNTFLSVTDRPVLVGELSGPGLEHIELTIHPNGRFTFVGEDVCRCALASEGLSGTIAIPFTGSGDASGSTTARFRIEEGTGGLSNMLGVGAFKSSDSGSSGTLSGTYHFDP